MLNGVKRMKSTVSFSAMKRQREGERERERNAMWLSVFILLTMSSNFMDCTYLPDRYSQWLINCETLRGIIETHSITGYTRINKIDTINTPGIRDVCIESQCSGCLYGTICIVPSIHSSWENYRIWPRIISTELYSCDKSYLSYM